MICSNCRVATLSRNVKNMDERIIQYTPDHRDAVELFRQQTFAEGNESLDVNRFDPANFSGQIWLAYCDDTLVSLSAAEVSHYTGESNVIRKCRYHILKSYRHGRYGFKFLNKMMPWCKENGFKLLYWTHDVNNKALNALYQRKRTYSFSNDNDWFHKWPYTTLNFERGMLFKTGDMLQFIYTITIDSEFVWNPQQGKHIIYCEHNGNLSIIEDLGLK
jgi:GNAT superfamily N-acetyltransferase